MKRLVIGDFPVTGRFSVRRENDFNFHRFHS